MSLKLTKNSSIVLACVILVLSVALGYLVWRVNQKETTAPTDSEAAECSLGSDCSNKCYWPETAYCNRSYQCVCMNVSEQQQDPTWNPCTDNSARCTPTCNPGSDSAECSARCTSCNNLYYVRIACEPGPICGDGTKDAGEECDDGGNNGKICTPTYGNSCTYCSSSCDTVTVRGDYCGDGKLNTGEECEPVNSPCTKDTKPGVCSSSCACVINPYCGDGELTEGEQCENYTDKLPSGAPCTWDQCDHSSCKCLPGNLTISKTVVERCIDEGTPDPKSELVYTITVTNAGSGPARPDKIEDVLDPKILSAGIIPTLSETPNTMLVNQKGVYSEGKILYDFNDSMMSDVGMLPGATFQTSYSIVISKANFGKYVNTATLTNLDDTTIVATANIDADCVASVPKTGIFDSTLGRISVGFILLLIGGVVYNLPSGFFIPKSKEKNFRYRIRFESKISGK